MPTTKKLSVKKAVVKQAITKKAAPKKSVVKIAVSKNPAVKKTVAKTAVPKKAVVKTVVPKKTVAKTVVPKKAVVKKAASKNPTVKKTVVKTVVPKKAIAKNVVAKKSIPKKAAPAKIVPKKAAPAKAVVKIAAQKNPAMTIKGERVEELITERNVELKSVEEYLGIKDHNREKKPIIPGVFDLLIPPGTPRKIVLKMAKNFNLEVVRRDDIYVPIGVSDVERDILAFRGDMKTVNKLEKILLKELEDYERTGKVEGFKVIP